MTSDSWERPSYTAGDVHEMGGRQFRGLDRPEGEEGSYSDLDDARSRREERRWAEEAEKFHNREPAVDWEPYHEPPELHEQGDLDALEEAGFYKHEPNVWRKEPTPDAHDGVFISHIPGAQDSAGKLRPWFVSRDFEEDPGTSHATAQGPGGAIEKADKMLHESSVFTHWTRIYE